MFLRVRCIVWNKLESCNTAVLFIIKHFLTLYRECFFSNNALYTAPSNETEEWVVYPRYRGYITHSRHSCFLKGDSTKSDSDFTIIIPSFTHLPWKRKTVWPAKQHAKDEVETEEDKERDVRSWRTRRQNACLRGILCCCSAKSDFYQQREMSHRCSIRRAKPQSFHSRKTCFIYHTVHCDGGVSSTSSLQGRI